MSGHCQVSAVSAHAAGLNNMFIRAKEANISDGYSEIWRGIDEMLKNT